MKLNKLVVAIGLVSGMVVVSPVEGGVAGDAMCKEAKAKAAAKRASDVLKAHMRNEKRPNDIKLAADISRGEARFTKALLRAQARGECSPDDGQAIAAAVDSFVDGLLGVISPACGDGRLAPGEECDGADDEACPGQCRANCTCTPCGGVGWGTCGGACPASETCGDIGFGCACIPTDTTPCGNSYPGCGGTCPAGQACGENGLFGCVCVPEEYPACGDALAPACDGACRSGLFCVTNQDTCSCIPGGAVRLCGSVEGSPSCLGGCPSEAPICRDAGGSCTCTAYPSRAFMDETGIRLEPFQIQP